jgi:aspartate carbamoyltransferase catalytic subunit
LLALLAYRPPAALLLIHPDGRNPVPPEPLANMARRGELDDCAELDVLLMVGLPPGTGEGYLDDGARRPYVLTGELVARMPDDAIVLNPMPVIDEIAADARPDKRVRIYDQSDNAVFVRMAILEMILGRRSP